MNKTPPTISEIEREFDKLGENQHKFYPSDAPDICQVCGEWKEDHFPLGIKVKKFLRHQIEKILECLEMEETEKSFIKTEELSNDAYKHYSGFVDGYNQTIEERNKKIKEIRK